MATAEAESHEQEEEVDYEEDTAEEPRNGTKAESAGNRWAAEPRRGAEHRNSHFVSTLSQPRDKPRGRSWGWD